MVSHGVVALLIAALAQAAIASASCSCACSTPAVVAAPCGPVAPAFEVGCCPGAVIEKKIVVPRTATETYSYQVPTYARRCYQQPAGVDRKVESGFFETRPVCETQETIVKVPTTDFIVKEEPLCRKTCTTSEYIIQIPIVETTCTSAPLCKKTTRQQDNTLTTVTRRTSCAKQVCTQNKVTETPLTQTVCQDYQGSQTKFGTKTVIKPEIIKKCVQLPPYKCLKPASAPGVSVTYPTGYNGATYAAGYDYPAAYSGPTAYSGPAPAFGSYPVDSAYSGVSTYPSGYSAAYPAGYGYSTGPVAYSTAGAAYGSYSADYPASYHGAASYSTYPTIAGYAAPAKTCTCV